MTRKLKDATPAAAADSQLPAMPNNPALALAQEPVNAPEGPPAIGWLGFHHDRSSRADEVREQLGKGTPNGHPYLCVGERFYDASGMTFQSLRAFTYHAELEQGTWEMKAVSLQPQPRGSKFKKNILSITLLLPGDKPWPSELPPVVATLSTWRSTKAGALERHLREVERTTKGEWAKENPTHGAMVSNVLPPYRVASALRIETQTAKSGFSYELAKAVPATVNLDQISALKAWMEDEALMAQLEAVTALYDSKVEELTEQAKETDG